MLVLEDSSISVDNMENEVIGSVLVLDELDTGVGGRLGRTVGRLLRNISTNHETIRNQVICVSHLPQVAVFASNHIKAFKTMDKNDKMEISFHSLIADRERAEELNAMMGPKLNSESQ